MRPTSKGVYSVYVIGAKRTPFCKYGGSLRELPASHAFAAAAKEALRSANIDAKNVDCTIVGNVNFLSQCDGGKTPRYCGIYSGVPIEKPALGVNKACGTGLQAIITSAVDIKFGTSTLCLTGGTDLMSTLPFLVRNARFGASLGTTYYLEDHIKKEFPDSYCSLTRTKTVENLAKKHNITREAVDHFALESYSKWKLAKDSNVFEKEIISIKVAMKKSDVTLTDDEISQPNINFKDLAEARPSIKDGHVVTEVNSGAPGDGAAALILASEDIVNSKSLKPLSRVVGWAAVGVAPELTGYGAIQAIKKLLEDLKMNINDIDLFEINETFGAEVLIAVKQLHIDPGKVNSNGGAIAMGNPVSATGARLATHIVHQLNKRSLRRGIAASSCGGGQGIAVMFERL